MRIGNFLIRTSSWKPSRISSNRKSIANKKLILRSVNREDLHRTPINLSRALRNRTAPGLKRIIQNSPDHIHDL